MVYHIKFESFCPELFRCLILLIFDDAWNFRTSRSPLAIFQTSFRTMNTGDAVGKYTDNKYLYCYQNNVVPLIYTEKMPYR
jgi:hypothetical protein